MREDGEGVDAEIGIVADPFRRDGLAYALPICVKSLQTAMPRLPIPALLAENQRWSMDFVADQLMDGRRFQRLTGQGAIVAGNAARQVDFSTGTRRVTHFLLRVFEQYGRPQVKLMDNGTEFTCQVILHGPQERHVQLCFLEQQGKPLQNVFSESFNGRLWDECLN